jgi:hypothetical protein
MNLMFYRLHKSIEIWTKQDNAYECLYKFEQMVVLMTFFPVPLAHTNFYGETIKHAEVIK